MVVFGNVFVMRKTRLESLRKNQVFEKDGGIYRKREANDFNHDLALVIVIQ